MHARATHEETTSNPIGQQRASRERDRPSGSHDAGRDQSAPGPTDDALSGLHRSRGNRAVGRLLSERVQPKLAVGRPGDAYEREADRVAERVMRMPDPTATDEPRQTGIGGRVQRLCSRCRERLRAAEPLDCPECERELSGAEPGGNGRTERAPARGTIRGGPSTARDMAEPGATMGLHRSPTAPGPDDAPPIVEAALASPGRPLDPASRRFMEARFDRDFGEVRAHTDDTGAAAARAINARAFTVGRDIVFGAGEYRQGTPDGRRLLAHELTHVVQQRGDRPPATGAVQRQEEAGGDGKSLSCSVSASRNPIRPRFCIEGETDASTGTEVSFHYIPGMTSCGLGTLRDVPPFATTVVAGGEFSWRGTSMSSATPGVGRMMGAVVGSGSNAVACCTRVTSDSDC